MTEITLSTHSHSGIETEHTLFSTLRSSFFLPMSYRRSALPTPAMSLPWNAIIASGTSFVSV